MQINWAKVLDNSSVNALSQLKLKCALCTTCNDPILWIERFSSTKNNFALDTNFDTFCVIVYRKLSSCCPYNSWKFFIEPPCALHIWIILNMHIPCNICRNGIWARDDPWAYKTYFFMSVLLGHFHLKHPRAQLHKVPMN
jgi:hypothetical protein